MSDDDSERPVCDGPDLMPELAIAEVRKVFAHGHEKYAGYDRGHADPRDRRHHLQKARSHFGAYQSGDRWDEDSGAHALAHTINRLLLVLERELRGLP